MPQIWAQPPEALARILGDWPAVLPLLVGTRDAMSESLRSDIRAIPIDPFNPALRQYLIASMGSLADERLRVLFLDNARRLIADEELQNGTLAQLAIYPRTIFRRALEHNAAAIILVHNHPSGDPRPSEEDIAATRKLEQIGRALEIDLLDHIVVTARHTHHIMSEEAMAGVAARSVAYMLRSPDDGGKVPDTKRIHANAEAAVRRRLLRRQLLGNGELFGEPAWDMLLDLFINECLDKPVSMSSLCVAAGIPTSSAMKLAQRLCDAGLLYRVPDHRDGRRNFMRISPDVAHRLRAYFAEGTE